MKANLSHLNGNTRILLGYLFLVVPIIIYYLAIQLFVVNIPFGDEFHTALLWLNSFEIIESAQQRFFLLFQQHNEHRIFTYYSAVLTDYSIFEVLNFKRLLWIGNLGLLVLLFLTYQIFNSERKNPWYLLPVVLLLFVPQHEISDWGIVAYGSIIQYSIVFASLICLNKTGRYYFMAAVILALIATFSMGSGMFVFLSGFIILGLKNHKEKKYWVLWSISMVIAILLYFTKYNFSSDGFKFEFIQQPINTALFFFTFFGTIFKPIFRNQLNLLTLMGFLSLGLLLFLMIFKWKQVRKHPIAIGMILFVILSAASAAVSRLSFGVVGATAPRYVLLQAVYLIMLYIIVIDVFKNRINFFLKPILIASFLLYGGRLVQNYYYMQRHKLHLEAVIINYHSDYSKIKTFAPPPSEIKMLLDQSQKNGFYFPPEISELSPETK